MFIDVSIWLALLMLMGSVSVFGFGLWVMVASWTNHWQSRYFEMLMRVNRIPGLPDDRQRFWMGAFSLIGVLGGLAFMIHCWMGLLGFA